MTYKKEAPESIQKMFSTIAHNYDATNHKMSFGLHKLWNKKLINSVHQANLLLDLCAGTGAIAFSYLEKHPKTKAILLDFCEEMLSVAKTKGINYENRFETIKADASSIPLPNDHVDAITMAYGIRNIKEPKKAFGEAMRVLKKEGTFAILELTRPQNFLLKIPHTFYLKKLLPLIGKKMTQQKQAYTYLSNSISEFISPVEVVQMLKDVGFTTVSLTKIHGGIATIFIGKKD